MTNLIISIIYLLVTFILTILCYKKYGKYGLYIWMCMSVIICNIEAVKVSNFFGFTVSMGNIAYGSIFLCTDILSEKYGEKEARKATKISFLTMLIFILFIQLFLQYEPSINSYTDEALNTIFSNVSRITIASLIAFFFSQLCDVKIYKFLKQKFNKIWLSNNVSTFISQLIDTIIFTSIAYLGELSIPNLFTLMITMLIFKYIIAILDTPFILLASKMKNVNEL